MFRSRTPRYQPHTPALHQPAPPQLPTGPTQYDPPQPEPNLPLYTELARLRRLIFTGTITPEDRRAAGQELARQAGTGTGTGQ